MGTREGGLKTAATVKERYGLNHYKRIGALGGAKSKRGGFGSDQVGPDGLTGKERARIAGAKGGRNSSKRKKGE